MRNFATTGILLLQVLPGVSALTEGKVEAGDFKAAMCVGCHGVEGYRKAYPKVVSVPMIGGQGAA